ncbi:MAG: restriction endonuclease subunit S [Duncaniella sp.]|nr:restriction endonuclease subunit S [Duncaniella sp.]
MNHNWEYRQLGDICDIKTGKLDANAKCPNGKYPFFTCDAKPYKIDTYAFDEEAILISGNGSNVGHVHYYNGKFNAYQRTYVLSNIKHVIPHYLEIFLKGFLRPYIYNIKKGGCIPFITLPMLKNFPIPSPPHLLQEQIVAELDQINALITKNRELLSHLDSLAQSVFYDTFGDTITNPKGWEVYSLEECVSPDCSISYGIVQPGEDYVNGVPVVRPVDFTHSRFVSVNNLKCINPEISDSYKRTILCGNEILICVRGTTGLVRLADMSLAGCNVTRGIVPLMFPATISRTYLYEYLKQDRPQDFIKYYTRGTTLKQINLSDLRKLPLLLPPLALQVEFARKMDAIEAQKAKVETEIAELETLRDARMDYWFA